jgi:hypothetical protein
MTETRAVPALSAAIRGAGIYLGADRRQRPVVLRIFGQRPTRAAAVGGVWLAHLLAFRAFAVGAQLVVRTGAPESWRGFAEAATGQAQRAWVTAPDYEPRIPAGPSRPLLLLDDVGLSAAAAHPAPWCAHVTLLRRLTAQGLGALKDADVVVMQRLSPGEATVAAGALRLDTRDEMRVQALYDDMVAVIGGGIDRHFALTLTPVELAMLGPPGRPQQAGG